MKRGVVSYILIWLISVAVFVSVSFIFPIEKNKLFYTLFISALIAFVMQLIISLVALNRKNNVTTYPVLLYSIIGLIMLFVIDGFLLFKHVITVPWIYMIVNIILLGLHYIFLILLSTSLNRNIERDDNVRSQIATMYSLIDQVKVLYDKTGNKDIYRLYEALKYSDKISNQKTADVDNRIQDRLNNLKNIVDVNQIKEEVDLIIVLVKER